MAVETGRYGVGTRIVTFGTHPPRHLDRTAGRSIPGHQTLANYPGTDAAFGRTSCGDGAELAVVAV